MRLLFFDVETTGLPTSFKINPSETKHWPYIVQIAWLITDYDNDKVLKESDYIIKPNDWEIPKEATRIHKISQKEAEENGIDITIVLQEFLKDLEETSVLVAHNIDFDINVLKAELHRLNINTNVLNNTVQFCTMKNFTNYCEIKKPHSYDYKWPTLEQLHEKVLGEPMAKKHSALADVYAVKFCFYALKKIKYFDISYTDDDILATQDDKLKNQTDLLIEQLAYKNLKKKEQRKKIYKGIGLFLLMWFLIATDVPGTITLIIVGLLAFALFYKKKSKPLN